MTGLKRPLKRLWGVFVAVGEGDIEIWAGKSTSLPAHPSPLSNGWDKQGPIPSGTQRPVCAVSSGHWYGRLPWAAKEAEPSEFPQAQRAPLRTSHLGELEMLAKFRLWEGKASAALAGFGGEMGLQGGKRK